MNIQPIITLRHLLHHHPEVSNAEVQTSQRITEYMRGLNPDEEVRLGSTGVAFVFSGSQPGPCLMFRAEMDALPITEQSDAPYASVNKGVSHACGHDGHMAILAGLGQKISECRPVKGKVVLLFQPAEEVEQGARDVVLDPAFAPIAPDMVFALHNIPGATMHQILLRNGSFAAASKGMTVKLTGKTSHAAEPDKGISPAKAIARIIQSLDELTSERSLFREMVLLTIIHIRMGEVSFGTTPGYAEVMITLRAFRNEDMEMLTAKTEGLIRQIASEELLKYTFGYSEDFPAVVNDPACVGMVTEAAHALGLQTTMLTEPFRWSEDFSYFTQNYPGCLFGLGAGTSQPELHHPDYDFPDEIIETGIKLFEHLYKQTNL
jgi:amidohydrolase